MISPLSIRGWLILNGKSSSSSLRAGLQKSKPAPPISDYFSPEQKVAIFRSLFRGRTDIYANRWKNQQGRSGYSVACNNEWVKGICNKPRIKCPDCNREGRHPIVFTERRDHAETLNNLLNENGIDSLILKGAMKAAERRHVDECLHSVQVVVATGKYEGEGFGLPRLDTLFLAMPIAWKGSLAQYAGRIQRESDGETQ